MEDRVLSGEHASGCFGCLAVEQVRLRPDRRTERASPESGGRDLHHRGMAQALCLPVTFQVRKNAVSPLTATWTGVDTASPSRRNVVSTMYSASETGAKYPTALVLAGFLAMCSSSLVP